MRGGHHGHGGHGHRAITQKISYKFIQFFIKYSIHHPLSADTSFKFLAIILFEIRHLQNSSLCLSKGRNLTRGDNSGKTKNMRRLFSMRNPYMKFQDDISMPPPPHTHTDKPKPICPPLFQSWGHKNPKLSDRQV